MGKYNVWFFLFIILIPFEYSLNAQVLDGVNILEKILDESEPSDTSRLVIPGLKAGEIYLRNPRIPTIASKNMLPNASFELGTDGWSSAGKETGWGGDLWSLFGVIDTTVFYEGKRSLRIDLGPGKTESTYFDVWPMARKAQTAPLAANRGWIEVVPGQKYVLSAYMRANRVGIPAVLRVYQSADLAIQVKINSQEKGVTLTDTWARYYSIISASDKQLFIAVGPDLANENDSATVWIDAVQLEKAVIPTDFQLRSPFEIGLSTGKFGNIFETGHDVAVKLTSINRTSNQVSIPVQCDITDYFDSKIYHGEKQIIVGSSGDLDLDWQLLIPGTGYYNVKFSWNYENIDYARSFPMALIDAYQYTDSHFGLNHSPTAASASYALQKAGMKWDRNWSVNWGLLEPQEGNLSFQLADEQIFNALKLGYNSLALLPPLPAPDWGSTAPGSVSASGWNRMSYMPSDVNKLMNFITTSIEHYKDKVKYWEFLNEPVWTSFCLPGSYYNLPGANYVPDDYIGLLKKAYSTMKLADPSCNVIGGFSAEPWRYMKEFIAADGLKSIDILNIHNYGGFAPPESFINEMDVLLSQMDQSGGRKPIWITEYSYYGADSLPWTPWKPPANYWGANLLLKDERQCADWTIRYNAIMFARGVEKVFYHEAIEGIINDGLANVEFAFMGEEGVPRKLYPANAAMASIMGQECTYSGQLENNVPPGNSSAHLIQGYSFQCKQKAVLIAWISEKENSIVQLQVPAGVDIFNIMGLKIPTSTEIILSNSPVYIVSDSLTASNLVKSCSINVDTYKLDVVLKDALTNLPVTGLPVSVSSNTVNVYNNSVFSGSDGISHFDGVPGFFALNIQDTHYFPVNNRLCSVSGDTAITVYLTRKGYDVKITLEDQRTFEKFWGVVVSFGSTTHVTDVNGQVVFSAERGSYNYSINKISYKPVTGNLTVNSDTSLIFPLEQISANVKFRLKEGITPVNNAIIYVSDDSLVTNLLGIALFNLLPLNNLYSYTINRDGYYDVSGEFYLVDDTIIDIQLEINSSGDVLLPDENEIRVWPNPFSDLLHCSFPASGSENSVIITDLVGNMVFSNIVSELELNISLRDIPSGAYIVKIHSKYDDFRKLFFKN